MGITQKFLFLAPGAVYISSGAYGMPKRQNAYISLAGAATNVALAFIFLFLAPLFGPMISSFAVRINLLLAIFNMLPVPPLDGSKVFAWDKKNWAIIFVGLLVLRSMIG
jgi:Zn-dependent protease